MVFLSVIGSVGGLISTWDPDFFSVFDKIINRRFIALVGTLQDGNHSFGFINVYGPSTDSEKKEFFEELSKVCNPPSLSFLKFNVDGTCSHEGKCGVGGVLRDAKGSILMEFSLSIGVGSALLADILAIKLAVEHFVNSPWVNRSRLIVESDSKVVVDWVSNPSLLSPFFLKFVQGISSFFTDGRCSIRHIQRVQNVSADILAKVGID
ncbi:hypothetical protein V6N13_142022 [Hibiscus sabdariffa]